MCRVVWNPLNPAYLAVAGLRDCQVWTLCDRAEVRPMPLHLRDMCPASQGAH